MLPVREKRSIDLEHDDNEKMLIYSQAEEFSFDKYSNYFKKVVKKEDKNEKIEKRDCRMSNCFDFSLCDGEFKITIVEPQTNLTKPSDIYEKVLSSILESPFYTDKIEDACVKILALDTIDRDPLSTARFVENLNEKIQEMGSLWNNGQNYLIFNLYSGTWPEYLEELYFDTGKAMLAKASIAHSNFRQGFDISLPLWPISHPTKGKHVASHTIAKWSPMSKYLVSFKGKRYLHGIGSEVRNALHHIHDGTNSIMLTTCRHGLV